MAELLSTGPLAIDQIEVKDRLRRVDPASVRSLMESIEQLGVMKDEVMVRQIHLKDDTVKHVLIAGGHRLEAAIGLNWTVVPAKIWRCSDDWARMMEVDDNLAHAELSTIELCGFLAERKRAFLGLKPHLRRGLAGSTARWEDATDTVSVASETSFVASVAAKRGLSERHVFRLLAIGEALAPAHLQGLYGLGVTPSFSELMALSKLEAQARDAALQSILSGQQPNIKTAIKAVAVKVEKPEQTLSARKVHAIGEMFVRLTAAERRQFMDNFGLVAAPSDEQIEGATSS